jgi:hypothetical protein
MSSTSFLRLSAARRGSFFQGPSFARSATTGLGHLDKAVADEFDFLVFMAGVPRKKGKPPLIKSRGNVLGSIEATGPTFTFNMEKHSVTAHDGSRLAPFRGSQRSVRATLSRDGDVGTVSYDVSFGDSPKFIRGLTKIAFSSLAYFLGPDAARQSAFAAVRSFVLDGRGSRHVLLCHSGDAQYRTSAWAPYRNQCGGYVVTFRIAQTDFLVDLTEEESELPILRAKMREQHGDAGWCVLPVRA